MTWDEEDEVDEEEVIEVPEPPMIWLLCVDRGLQFHRRGAFHEEAVWPFNSKEEMLDAIKHQAEEVKNDSAYWFRWKASCVPDMTAEIEDLLKK